ncbi:class I SAM-dependent DNA methyltransferase [Limoniibacter endophyticus]|uniref:Methyltransferase n=1 Tax=Limoniibacter endophyticus TaxID=1565040 RepID=A0A8J3DL27_9HYPH|nr:methyltransferase domain-containing protein [Limoniibacter endophyticus]GHC66535.1 methyltransferase [Limoniibacter endophyticus]
MKPVNLSSGNLHAERRADYAELMLREGDAQAAAEIMRDALEIAPTWVGGWFRLGEIYEKLEKIEEASAAWREALKLDPQDHAGARLKLELIGARPIADTPPTAFVETLFDQYAARFDTALVGKLGYQVPELIAQAIADIAPATIFQHVLDLGCGTGLMAEHLHKRCGSIDGFDLSLAMLKKAKVKGLYSKLVKADLNSIDLEGHSADLVTAADVFVYVGSLDHVFAQVAVALAPDAFFAFSVEHHQGEEDFDLRPSRRYAHSPAYIKRLLAENGMKPLRIDADRLRYDRNEPVAGLIVVATKSDKNGLA